MIFLWITGFLPDEFEDGSIKYDLEVAPQYEKAVLDILRWENMEEESDGEWLMTLQQVQEISLAINEAFPVGLDLFIGVRSAS